jgi:hypothetical protein
MEQVKCNEVSITTANQSSDKDKPNANANSEFAIYNKFSKRINRNKNDKQENIM